MSEEKPVKLAIFLKPEFNKAVKIQAARQGSGVSEIVRTVVTCSHCKEPITDEFIIGEPKEISQGKYDVFYHKNRPECRKASGRRIAYVPICNSCHMPAYQSYEREELPTLVQSGMLKFYCIRCNHIWPATMEDAGQLILLLQN